MSLRPSLYLHIGTALAIVAVAPGASAQVGREGMSQLDIRPPDATAKLNENLARLGDNPRDISALIGAGEAALDLDDPRAATGFFARADEMQGTNGRIKAGLGRAMLQLQNPSEALKLFDQAERLRYPTNSFMGDRALARDLTGDQAGAQRDYQAALRSKPDDADLIKRYAVSLGISGQVDAAERVIQPLLYKNDREAWRDRAFIFAMNGRVQQARDITLKVMPGPLATAIQPYMERMAGLTPAQRAAAVHFGNFPANASVRASANPGVRVASNAGSTRYVTPGSAAAAGRPALPGPAPSAGRAMVQPPAQRLPQPPSVQVRPSNNAAVNPAQTMGRVTTATPSAGNSTPPARTIAPVPAQRSAGALPAPTPTPAPVDPRTNVASSAPRVVQGPIDPAPVRSFPPAEARAAPPVQQPQQIAPAAPTPPTPNPVATRTLADIIKELSVPEAEMRTQVAAVDLAEVMALQERKRAAARAVSDKAKRDAAAKAKAVADAKAKEIAAEKAKLANNPARSWVQVGTGQSTSALGFTWRGLKKKYDSLNAKDAFTAPWGRTNRLVVGPFTSFSKARDLEASLKKSGADVFAWQSDAGEVVVPVGGGK